MSASRTLLRKHEFAGMIRNDEGELVKRVRIAPGTRRRRVKDVSFMEMPGRDGWSYAHYGYEADYHATKGYRVRKAT